MGRVAKSRGTRWLHALLYLGPCKLLLYRFGLLAMYGQWPRLVGRRRIPRHGPLVLAAAHRGPVDTFLLTATGLTLLLSLGGGVNNLLKGEGMGTVEVIQILSFVIPGAFTLSLPVAGLFSAAMIYGRLTADNELNACRAGGVNVHFLLAPVLGLGLIIAVTTFWFSNFVIPGYIKNLNEIVGKNAFRIVMNELRSSGVFEFRGNVIHVDRIDVVEMDEVDSERSAQRFHARRHSWTGAASGRGVQVDAKKSARTEGFCLNL